MPDTTLPVNRHPVDELAEVRAQIKDLEEREKALKTTVSTLMGDRDSIGGDEFIARQTLTERAGSVDTAAMKKAGIDVDKYRKAPTAVVTIKCERRVLEDA
jgi:hypothetical protein